MNSIPTTPTTAPAAAAPDTTEVTSPRCPVLGVGISPINLQQAVNAILDWVARRDRHYVTVTGVHGVMESQRDPELKRILNRAGMVTPDGMPMVWLSQSAGYRHVSRVYGPDLMLQVCRDGVAPGARHFLYGGCPGVADELATSLGQRFPGIQIAGTYCPPFRPLADDERRELAEQINASGADVVWVGLSCPKQERWMAEMRPLLAAPVLIGVGAAFDFHTGRIKQAPGWMQRNGLEWFFRLLQEPRRLWKRYLTNNPLFVWNLLLARLGWKRFPMLD